MSPRAAARLSWSVFAVSVMLLLVGWGFSLAADDVPAFDVVSSVILVVLPAMGALVATRLPANPIGWLFLAAGFLLALAGATFGYGGYALDEGAGLPGGVAASWVTSWAFLPAIFGVPSLLFLLFPDGHLLSPRWRPVLGLTLVSLVSMALAEALRPGELRDAPVPDVENPLGVDAFVVTALEPLGWVGGLVCLLLSVVSVALRYRTRTGVERQQLRWVVFSGVLFVATCAAGVVLWNLDLPEVGQATLLVGYCVIPVGAAVAILRYRLYDIDLVIKRTVVYGVLTAALVSTYLVSVLVFRLVLDPVAGDSDLAVAASTLAVAGLFRPLRSRVQSVVDRRFYRSRYDAVRTLDAFATRLRDELDLEALGTDLRAAVHQTMAPAHVSLWLRQREESR
jgi:hypothetical protein